MESDKIQEIGIDEYGRLFIRPEKKKFPLFYRTATEVGWDNIKNVLYSPKPREWTYLNWYHHIVSTVEIECDCELKITRNTLWTSISEILIREIRNN